jgi:hypothetical protein
MKVGLKIGLACVGCFCAAGMIDLAQRTLREDWGSPATNVEVHYAPEENLEKIDVRLIDSARATLDMAAYVLTDKAVIKAQR